MAACGSSSAPGRHDVVTRGDAICTQTLSRVRAVTPPAGATPAALAPYLARVAPIVEAQARSIAALPRPAQGRGTLDAFVSEVQAGARAYDAARRAAADGDADGLAAALASLRSNRAAPLAARYGMRVCTGTVATLGR